MHLILTVHDQVGITEYSFRHQRQNLALFSSDLQTAFFQGQNLRGLGGNTIAVAAFQPPVDSRGDVERVPAFVDVGVPVIDLLRVQHHRDDG